MLEAVAVQGLVISVLVTRRVVRGDIFTDVGLREGRRRIEEGRDVPMFPLPIQNAEKESRKTSGGVTLEGIGRILVDVCEEREVLDGLQMLL